MNYNQTNNPFMDSLDPINLTLWNRTDLESGEDSEQRYSLVSIIVIIVVATCLSLITVVGNIMVMISFKIDKQLQTISNYYLFSLAVADFAVGLISMPLFTVYTVLGYWPLGPHVCDAWLALDYLASNASVLNLLIISFDRYFSVTRPLTYRAKRTTLKASIMIACAWGISVLLWPPWIYAWPYIEGKRTVPEDACYIQFIETNHYITFGTAIAAFYVPVSVMIILYWRIWQETEKRQKDLPNLQAVKQDASKRSNSSDEALDMDECRRPRSESSTGGNEDMNSMHVAASYLDKRYPQNKGKQRPKLWTCAGLKEWCVAWWHSGREEDEDEEDDDEGTVGPESSRTMPGYEDSLTPMSVETPLTSVNSRCPSFSVLGHSHDRISSIEQPDYPNNRVANYQPGALRTIPGAATTTYSGRNSNSNNDPVYTILIRLPPPANPRPGVSRDAIAGFRDVPSIRMYPGEGVYILQQEEDRITQLPDQPQLQNRTTPALPPPSSLSKPPDIRIPLNAQKISRAQQTNAAPSTTTTGTTSTTATKPAPTKPAAKKKPKKKLQERKADRKAAKTLSAILAAFIITWTPYNILVLLKPVTSCQTCIPQDLWDFFYYLCYINSTVNPVCYALCNATFRRTYVRILKCKWHSRNRTGISRGY